MKTIDKLIDNAYDKLFHEVCELSNNFNELKIEYQDTDGKTIIISWKDREARLKLDQSLGQI